jgi:hypothetical protein
MTSRAEEEPEQDQDSLVPTSSEPEAAVQRPSSSVADQGPQSGDLGLLMSHARTIDIHASLMHRLDGAKRAWIAGTGSDTRHEVWEEPWAPGCRSGAEIEAVSKGQVSHLI